jgi:hypothetical protein
MTAAAKMADEGRKPEEAGQSGWMDPNGGQTTQPTNCHTPKADHLNEWSAHFSSPALIFGAGRDWLRTSFRAPRDNGNRRWWEQAPLSLFRDQTSEFEIVTLDLQNTLINGARKLCLNGGWKELDPRNERFLSLPKTQTSIRSIPNHQAELTPKPTLSNSFSYSSN